MKARTLIITAGAVCALVGVTVQPAGAQVASQCSVSHKVLVVGNGTKAPYSITIRTLLAKGSKSCTAATAKKAKQAKHVVHTNPTAPVIQPAVPLTPLPSPSPEACSDAQATAYDSYVELGVQSCSDATTTPTGGSSASAQDSSSAATTTTTSDDQQAAAPIVTDGSDLS
jgi:hypothetical protein